jgi:hypothetical protein
MYQYKMLDNNRFEVTGKSLEGINYHSIFIGDETKAQQIVQDLINQELDKLKLQKLEQLKNNYQTWYENYLSKYPPNERASFQEKAKEALAWNKDNNAPTPIIDAILKGYGNTITKADFVQAILNKVTYLAEQEGKMVAKRDAIKAATTIDELNNIDIRIKN